MNFIQSQSLMRLGSFVPAALLALAVSGAVRGSPENSHVVSSVSVCASQRLEEAEWHGAPRVQKIDPFGRDLRAPRTPRQKGYSTSSQVCGEEGSMGVAVLACPVSAGRGSRVVPIGIVFPLDGHPLSLLRPPSLVAG